MKWKTNRSQTDSYSDSKHFRLQFSARTPMPSYAVNFSFIGGICISLSIIVTLVLYFWRLDQEWYSSRAIAESVKTLSWRYIMRAHPFGSEVSNDAAKELFLSELEEVIKSSGSKSNKFVVSKGVQITPWMTQVRGYNFDERKALYIKSRLLEQQSWYANKSKFNGTKEKQFLSAMILFQVVALIWSFSIATQIEVADFTGLFVALSISALTWMQTKRFRELEHSYAITANELSLNVTRSENVSSDKELSDFIANNENAISREHTLWVARRDH